MLAVARNIVSTNRWVHEGKWQTAIGVDVCGKTLGLMGFGAIAKTWPGGPEASVCRCWPMTPM